MGRPVGKRSKSDAAPPGTVDLASALRGARERAGLSVRDLASRLGVSPSTVSEVERGGDVLHSTLARYLTVLPGLAPQSLLGHGAAARPEASPLVFAYLRDAFGFTVERVVLRVDVDAQGLRTTHLAATGVRSLRGEMREPATRAAVMQLIFRGSAGARPEVAAAAARLQPGASAEVQDGCYRHRFHAPHSADRWGLGYERLQVPGEEPPAGLPPPGSLPVSAPFQHGVSFAIEYPIEELELGVRFEKGQLPDAARAATWTDVQSLAADEPDFAPFLHPGGLSVARVPRSGTLRLTVPQPVFALQYGITWDEPPQGAAPADSPGAVESPRDLASRLRLTRERAGLSQRELATRLQVSPVTVARVERGHDIRCGTLFRYLRELPALCVEDLFPEWRLSGPLSRLDAWEHYRAVLGIEAEEERKTLVITPEGDAHAVCETLRLRRVRPSASDLRIRYPSVTTTGRRLPTVLKAIEEAIAAEAEDSGLKARVVSRREGRLIHEITVPQHLAQVGASYARRLYDARFFDPRADDEAAGAARRHDGAAIVPYHAVRRLRLTVKLPPGEFPERVWFGVHPRMMLEGPLEEADVSHWLHPEGLDATVSKDRRELSLSVDHPLVGFIYDVFWLRP